MELLLIIMKWDAIDFENTQIIAEEKHNGKG